ncbi:hypothetical protein GEMRC1_004616 [Eukaryota sp. GEM-RC1]
MYPHQQRLQPQQPPNPLFSLVNSIPPVTRILLVLLIGTFVLLITSVVSPYDLFFDATRVFKHFQLWRVVTAFTYMGTDLISVFFSLITLYRTCVELEQSSFHGKPEDMAYMIILGMMSFLTAGWFLSLPFLFYSLFFLPHVYLGPS